MKKNVHYFDIYGPENTRFVIDAVLERLLSGGIKCVIVASTSGKTAIQFAKNIAHGEIPLICVSDPPQSESYPGVTPKNRKLLSEMDVTIVDRIPYASVTYLDGVEGNLYGALDIRVLFFDAFKLIGGSGLKVAIEVCLMATDAGIVLPGEKIISVGGTENGADTAIVMKSAFSQHLISKDPMKRPEVYEILAMPVQKKW